MLILLNECAKIIIKTSNFSRIKQNEIIICLHFSTSSLKSTCNGKVEWFVVAITPQTEIKTYLVLHTSLLLTHCLSTYHRVHYCWNIAVCGCSTYCMLLSSSSSTTDKHALNKSHLTGCASWMWKHWRLVLRKVSHTRRIISILEISSFRLVWSRYFWRGTSWETEELL